MSESTPPAHGSMVRGSAGGSRGGTTRDPHSHRDRQRADHHDDPQPAPLHLDTSSPRDRVRSAAGEQHVHPRRCSWDDVLETTHGTTVANLGFDEIVLPGAGVPRRHVSANRSGRRTDVELAARRRHRHVRAPRRTTSGRARLRRPSQRAHAEPPGLMGRSSGLPLPIASQPPGWPISTIASVSAARIRRASRMVDHPTEAFWSAVWDFTGVRSATKGDRIFERAEPWYWKTRCSPKPASTWPRPCSVTRTTTWPSCSRRGRLRRDAHPGRAPRLGVATPATALRVAAWVPATASPPGCRTSPRPSSHMLATISIGAVFSSTSPDFGVNGVVDRFGQIEPRCCSPPTATATAASASTASSASREIARRAPGVAPRGACGYLDDTPTVDAHPDASHVWTSGSPPSAARRSIRSPLAVRPPVVHPVLVGHHRRAEVHRAPHRRRAAQAPQEHQLHCDIAARRPGLLLHDHAAG